MENKSHDLISKINQFKDDRLRAINTKKAPVRMYDGPKMVMHIVPVSAFEHKQPPNLKLELTEIEQAAVFLDNWSMQVAQSNSNRYLFCHSVKIQNSASGRHMSYIQLSRAGVLEFVMNYPKKEGSEKLELPATKLGDDAIQFLKDGMALLKAKKIDLPYYVFMNILNVHSYKLELLPRLQLNRESATYDRDCLFLPELLIENDEVEAEKIMRPLLDMVWYTFYEEACLDYGKDGKWMGLQTVKK